jgi:hypothetical protein
MYCIPSPAIGVCRCSKPCDGLKLLTYVLLLGLAAARHALELYGGEKEVEVTIYEKAAHVGGLWNNHPSAIYAHLRANTPAPIMQLEGCQQQEPDDSSYLPCQVGRTGQNTF